MEMTIYEKLRRKYGLMEAQIGVNEDNEPVIISIDQECAWIKTLQDDHRWHRVNVYWKSGVEEEYYE